MMGGRERWRVGGQVAKKDSTKPLVGGRPILTLGDPLFLQESLLRERAEFVLPITD